MIATGIWWWFFSTWDLKCPARSHSFESSRTLLYPLGKLSPYGIHGLKPTGPRIVRKRSTNSQSGLLGEMKSRVRAIFIPWLLSPIPPIGTQIYIMAIGLEWTLCPEGAPDPHRHHPQTGLSTVPSAGHSITYSSRWCWNKAVVSTGTFPFP
jgi:hypothetical protein